MAQHTRPGWCSNLLHLSFPATAPPTRRVLSTQARKRLQQPCYASGVVFEEERFVVVEDDVVASFSSAPRRPASTHLCKQLLLQQEGGATALASLLQGRPPLAQQLFADDDLASQFANQLIAESSTDAVEEVFHELRSHLSRATLAAAAAAFAAKNSAKGVSSVERMAAGRNLLRGPQSAGLWFALIQAYGKMERLPQVRRAFKAAQFADAWTAEDTRHTNIYLNALHTDIALAFDRARQLLDAGAVADATTFNTLLKACMRAKDAARATLVMRWMERAKVTPDAVTWSSLIKARSYGDDLEGVLATRQAMAASGFELTPDVWGSLLVACGVAEEPETALMLWREAKAALGGAEGVPVNLWNAMMTACNSCGHGERTLALLTEMKEAGVRPKVRTYTLAINATRGPSGKRLRQAQLAAALELYDEMRVAGLHPDLFTYGSLMELAAEASRGELATRLLAAMDGEGIKPNVVVMTSLLKALARSGMVEECQQAFGRMVWGPARLRPNRVTFRTLIHELREAGALGAALRAYVGMRKARFSPNNAEFQELIAAAAEAALAEGDPELQAQVAALCNVKSLELVDLHGMSTLEARAAVLCVLSMLLTQYHESGVPPAALCIITGKGNRSEDGQAVIPSTVRRLCKEELKMHLDREFDVGRSSGNTGRIVVSAEQLLRWLRARAATRSDRIAKRREEAQEAARANESAAPQVSLSN